MQMREKGKAQFHFLVERVVRLGRVSFVSVFSGLILVAASLELKSATSESFLDDLDLKNFFSTVAEAAGCWGSRAASALLEDADFLAGSVLSAADRFSISGRMFKSSLFGSEDFKVLRLAYFFSTGGRVNSTIGGGISCVFLTIALVFFGAFIVGGVGKSTSLSLSLEYRIGFWGLPNRRREKPTSLSSSSSIYEKIELSLIEQST